MSAKTNLVSRKSVESKSVAMPEKENTMTVTERFERFADSSVRHSAPPAGWNVGGPSLPLPIKDGYEGLAYSDPETLPVGAQPLGYRPEPLVVPQEPGEHTFRVIVDGLVASIDEPNENGYATLRIGKAGDADTGYGSYITNKNMVKAVLSIIRAFALEKWQYTSGIITKRSNILQGGGYVMRDPHFQKVNGKATYTEDAIAWAIGDSLRHLQAATGRKVSISPDIREIVEHGLYACALTPTGGLRITHRSYGAKVSAESFTMFPQVAAALESGPFYITLGPDTMALGKELEALLNDEGEELAAAKKAAWNTRNEVRGKREMYQMDVRATENIRKNVAEGEAPRQGEGVGVYNGKKQTVTVEMLQKDIENVKKAYPQAKEYQIKFISTHRKTGVENGYSIKGGATLEERAARINQGFYDWRIGVAIDPGFKIKA